MSYVPHRYALPDYQGDAFPRPTQAALLADVPDDPDATGVVSGISIPAPTSSIDPAITLGVSCVVDAGVRARATALGEKLPVIFTPYTYNNLLAPDSVRDLMTRKGFIACIPVTRGRGFSTGAIDDSGRELYDFKDCLAAVAAAVPEADGRFVDFCAWSGGAANALALVAKYPGLIRNALLCFGWGDYGCNPDLGRSFWGAGIGGYQALMTTRIGDRVTQIERYRTRCIWPALPYALAQSSGLTWTFWDAADPIGLASQDMRVACGVPSVPPSRWQAEESEITSPTRWTHGLPDVGVNDLGLLMNLVFQRRDAPPPLVASVGEYHVPGHVVHGGITPAWELWTAPTGTVAPRTTALGGTQNCAFVRFNASTGLFYVTPLGGDCAVEILWNGVSKVADVSGPDTLFDMAN